MVRFLFGGKGGVGKTTISAAFALLLAQRYHTLLVSTDPAHSLTDIFEVPIDDKETIIPVPGEFRGKLCAIELDPQRAIQNYKYQTLRKVRRLGLHLDFDVEKYVDTIAAAPGAQESAIFDQFAEQLARQDVEMLVFDMAPSGATLQLLQLSNLIDRWISVIIRARVGIFKLRSMAQPQNDDAILTELNQMKKSFGRVKKLLTHKSTHFIFVVLPEKLPFNETQRVMDVLRKNKFKTSGIVVNRIIPFDKIGFEALRQSQAHYLEKIRTEWHNLVMAEVPWWHTLPQGVAELRQLAGFLATTQLGIRFMG